MEASTAVSSRLIGAFFVEKGLVTQEQLELALQKQEASGERLGEIIVAEFGVSRLELASVLAEQWAEFERDNKAREVQAGPAVPPTAPDPAPTVHADDPSDTAAVPVEPQLRRPIGEIFLERGFVTADDLDRALDVQRETGTRLGEVLVGQGSLSRLDLASALAEQWSALQKLRPPEPVAAEPWQNGAPVPSAGTADIPADLRRSMEELEERVRIVERVSAATPWNEDLRLLGDTVRAAIATVEERVTRTATRVDPAQLDALGSALDELRERVQEPAARLDAVEQRLGELPSVEALEGRLEARLAELRAALEGSTADAAPAEDITGLHERVDELATRVVAPAELEELRAQVAALAGGTSSADEVAVLHAAVDELAARSVSVDDLAVLQARLDEMALRVVVPEALAEVRAEVAALSRATPQAEELAALRATVEDLATGTVSADELVSLRASLEELSSRAVSADELAVLRARVEEVAAGSGLADELAALRARLDEMALRVVVPEALAEVRAEVAALSRATPQAEELAALRATVEDLATGTVPADELASLGARVDELAAGAIAADEVAALRARVEELASRSLAPEALDQVRAELAALAARPAVRPEAIDELHERLGALAETAAAAPAVDPELAEKLADVTREAALARAEAASLASQVEALAALHPRVDELAERLPAEHQSTIAELRRSLDEIAGRVAGDVPREEHDAGMRNLLAQLEELGARVESIDTRNTEPSGPRLREILDGLRAEIGSLAERPVVDADALEARLAGLEQRDSDAALEALVTVVEEQRTRIDRRLDELVQRQVDPAVVDELRAWVADVADRAAAAAVAESVEARLAEIEARLVNAAPLDEVRLEIGRLAESAAIERSALEHELRARVEELAASTPATADVAELRRWLEELAARPSVDDELRGRVDELSARVEQALALAEAHHDLRRAISQVEADGTEVFAATAERLAGVESAVAALDGVEWRLQTHLEESVAVRAGELEQRLDGSLRRLEALDALEERIEALKDDLDAHPAGALEEVAGGLRAELARLADRLGRQERALAELPEPADPTLRLDDLGLRLDGQARLAAERLGAVRDDLRARVDEVEGLARRETSDAVARVYGRVDELEGRLEGLARRDEVRESIAEQAVAVAAELEALRRTSAEREQALAAQLAGLADRASVERIEERLAEHDRQLADTGLRDELTALASELRDRSAALETGFGQAIEAARAEAAGRTEASSDALRRELDSRTTGIHEQLASQESGLAGLRAQLEELRAAAAGQEEWRLQVEAMVNDRVAEVEQRFAAESSETRERVERAEQALTTEVGSLAARLDELLGLRHQDLQAARRASDALAATVDELHALRGEDAEAAHAAANELSSRMEGLAASLRSEAAAAAAAARTVSERVDQLQGLRSDDLEASRSAGAELVARLDDLAIRTAAAAAEADRALRSDLYTLAATIEEKDAAGIEARDELRLELERAASSMGWRLERIEEALASEDQERLRGAVAELERRLEQQIARQDEQVRVTERAIRKGLASLGERLVETQTGYLDAGNALRRSIERLGAAVVEADARMADQIPVSEVEGHVAFAPTSDGYRLVQVPGRAPELGATVEIEGIEGPLVVTRLGRSPLPLDSRPCVYLDRP
jgi:hypothetical protein